MRVPRRAQRAAPKSRPPLVRVERRYAPDVRRQVAALLVVLGATPSTNYEPPVEQSVGDR